VQAFKITGEGRRLAKEIENEKKEIVNLYSMGVVGVVGLLVGLSLIVVHKRCETQAQQIVMVHGYQNNITFLRQNLPHYVQLIHLHQGSKISFLI
jgi:hypothetical protein